MDFGNTIEEKYAKISAINKLCNKFVKVTKIVLTCSAIVISLSLFFNTDEKLKCLIFAVLQIGITYFVSDFFGRTYFWSWYLICEKYNPKHLAFSFLNAVDDSATYGYVFGGSSGAKEAAFGSVVVIFIFAAFYISKGQKYAKKYKNLPRTELELKKQLDAKYKTNS